MQNKFKINFLVLCSVLSPNIHSQIVLSHDFEQIPQSDKIKNVSQVEGVKGLAANFNGYTSEWEEDIILSETVFVEAWIAPKEYSYNVSAIVNQQNDRKQGFLLGINNKGQLVATFYADGEQKDCISEQPAPLLKWSHIALSYRSGQGVRLFLNGKLVKSLDFTQAADFCPACPLVIGKTQIKGVPSHTERSTSRAQTTWMRFNGLIDELKIAAAIPSESALTAAVEQTGKAGVQALQFPQMPSAGISQGTFGAYYTRLYFDKGWESVWKTGDYPDVVVRFPDSPVKYIFWRGTGGYQFQERITRPFNFGWVEGYSTFPCWNHWPVSQIRSDGRNSTSPDRASHSSLAATNGDIQIVEYNSDSTQVTVRQMLGMTDKPIQSLLPLARSWNYAPQLKLKTGGYENKGYDVYQRAYRITCNDAKGGLDFTVQASESSPIENLALIIENRNSAEAKVSINGKKTIRGKDYEIGYIQGLEENKMIVWIYLESTKPVSIAIKP
jgi:hypothetical protein